jgi:hypothetical protein
MTITESGTRHDCSLSGSAIRSASSGSAEAAAAPTKERISAIPT